jgi:HD-GYP domain-containing protein (c-di-GMP phosphodiesterase class II)
VAVNEIERCAESQFDPAVSNLFLEAIERDREERQDRGEPVPE